MYTRPTVVQHSLSLHNHQLNFDGGMKDREESTKHLRGRGVHVEHAAKSLALKYATTNKVSCCVPATLSGVLRISEREF